MLCLPSGSQSPWAGRGRTSPAVGSLSEQPGTAEGPVAQLQAGAVHWAGLSLSSPLTPVWVAEAGEAGAVGSVWGTAPQAQTPIFASWLEGAGWHLTAFA